MTTQEIRQLFLDFFTSRDHLHTPSAPLVLHDDPTSLFTSAGMQPFMGAFRGEETPPAARVTSVQKCCRTNDIEGVGFHNRYATFFEMLGNFSFGDYFKEGAIDLAWELFNDVLKLERERLWFTVYTDDDEAEEIWHRRIGIPRERIIRFGRSDNWWPKAQWEGPCGPCTEIHYDLGEHLGCERPDCRVNCECDRYLELWNLVFQQYTEAPDGTLTPLPKPGIDTGMGLERLALVLQEKNHVAETSEMWQILTSITEAIAAQRGRDLTYGDNAETDLALRIITDHLRSASFIIADGVVPANEGAGYVLRRFIRRAYRFGRRLGAHSSFMAGCAETVARAMGGFYPELADKSEFTASIIRREEERFSGTLEQGINLFEEIVEQLDADTIPGTQAFTLYDTYGFPLEMTVEMAAERNLRVDEAGFAEAMAKQRVRSRGTEGKGLAGSRSVELGAQLPATEFVGYETIETTADVVGLIRDNELVESLAAGESGAVALAQTPFYAEQGGQVGDTGEIRFAAGRFTVERTELAGDTIIHWGVMAEGQGGKESVQAVVDGQRRDAIRRNHTATHLLHEALRRALGSHVDQAGSLVGPDRLRFDFTHHEGVDEDTLADIEDQVNAWILADLPVSHEQMKYTEARNAGARALFTEKYGDTVRTVRVNEVSMELCGGTHCERTSSIGSFRIVGESSISAGMRRIEAVTGMTAVQRARSFENQLVAAAGALNCRTDEVAERIGQLHGRIRELQEQVREARKAKPAAGADEISAEAQKIGDLGVVAREIKGADGDALMVLVDQVTARLGEGVALLAAGENGKVVIVCKATDGAVAAGVHAGNIVREVATVCGGGGGGKPQFARAGGSQPEKIAEALAAVAELVRRQVGQ